MLAGIKMKRLSVGIVAVLALTSFAARADETNDAILRRLDALEKRDAALEHENTALRDRLRHVETHRHAPTNTVSAAADTPHRSSPSARAYTATKTTEASGFAWAGAHVGVFGGFDVADPTYGVTDFFSDGVVGEGPSNPGNATTFGGLFGVAAGWDWQRGALVYGVEGDFAGVATGRNLSEGDYVPGGFEVTSKTTAIATIRARAGVAVDRALLFGTIGLGEIRATQNISLDLPAGERLTHTVWTPALAMGGGIEYALTDNIVVEGEALYMPAATQKFTARFPPNGGSPIAIAFSLTPSQTIARAGVNYKF
jgi:outer membrane immunogenic protein